LSNPDVRVEGSPKRKVVLVDDDPAVRESTAVLLRHAGHHVEPFISGEALIEAGVPKGTDIILLDIMMPGRNGLETLRALGPASDLPPVIMLTGHGDIPLAVEAMKLGAVEFLEKPYSIRTLLDLVANVDSFASTDLAGGPQEIAARAKIASLTPRQRDVLKGVGLGEPSKVLAHRLGLSVRTVEAYRSQLFTRLEVRSTAEAVRLAVLAGLLEP
jgi:two-component system response regulator FixJ